MSDGTKIEWADATLNYVNGCSVLSPGCTNCYAMKQAHRFEIRRGLTQHTKGGMVWTGEVQANDKALHDALRWRRPRRIFWNAHGDLFHEAAPDVWIDQLFAVCAMTPQHTHMILTKRSARMREYFAAPDWKRRVSDVVNGWPSDAIKAGNEFTADWRLATSIALPNVWLGVSVEDQKRAEERIPDLIATPAAVRFISAEPLLGPLDLGQLQEGLPVNAWLTWLDALDWAIVGGESGNGARPMHPDWARLLRDQCKATETAFLFKQWGEWAPVSAIDLDGLDADLYYKPRHMDASRRCKVDQCVLQASGRRFEQDRWSRIYGENPAARDFAFLAGTGAMSMMKIGKKRAGRLLDGVEHNDFPNVQGVRT